MATKSLDTELKSSPSSPKLWGSWSSWLLRITIRVTIVCFMAILVLYYQRLVLSFGFVCMANNKSNITNYFGDVEDWGKELQGHALGAIFYGHLLTPIMAGRFSDKNGAKLGIVLGTGVMSLCTILTPFAIRTHHGFVIGIRVIQGVMSGMAIPSIYKLLVVWTAPEERTAFMSFVLSAEALASVFTPLLSGYLCQIEYDHGWPILFYVPGFAGLILTIFLYFMIRNKPSDHPEISEEEKDYLMQFQTIKSGNAKLPVCEMLKSLPFHVLWITHVAFNWCLYLTAVNLPLFIGEAFKKDITETARYSAIPWIGMSVLGLIIGNLFDKLSGKNICSKTNLRKAFNSLGFFIPAICTFGLHLPCENNLTGAIVLITVMMSSLQFAQMGGFFLSHNDLVGQHTGLVFGITNTLSQVPGIVTPLLVGYLTPDESLDQWLTVYDISGAVCLVGGIIYLFGGSSELQQWARNDPSSNETQDTEKMILDPVMFAEKEYSYSTSSSSSSSSHSQHQWPSNMQKQDGRILFVDTVTQPFNFSDRMMELNSYDYKDHRDMLY